MQEIKLEAPVFIIFSEYLGYVSPFTNLAEEWCDGKIPPIHMQKVIMVEAKCILRQMKKDYTKKEIIDFYNDYDELILEDYKEKLANPIS